MGEAEIDKKSFVINIHADIVLYGNAAGEALAKQVAADIALHWNEPQATIILKREPYRVNFIINGIYEPALTELDVLENINPRKNYFRVEEFAHGNISFVDGINSNTGYFKLENLLNNSTTAAHEFGHSLGLEHPENTDIRGRAVPGIMYPRGSLVDPPFQYDPAVPAGLKGGTLNPFLRRVLPADIELLGIEHLDFNESGFAMIGDFTSVWHEAHIP